MVIWLERCADLHMAQLMLLPLTVSCFSKIQIGFTFLLPAYPSSPGKRAIKRVCVCVLLFREFLKSMNIWQSYGQNGWLCHMPHSPFTFVFKDAALVRYRKKLVYDRQILLLLVAMLTDRLK